MSQQEPASPEAAHAVENKRRCFVVMGFGIKTDPATGRRLDLEKSYRALIKPVVEGRGLTCIRADEIHHSGLIDSAMYEELLTADVVIADVSTANPNALYELGIRHALRPRTTIVISEDKLPYPFDLNHIAVTKYTHLGEAIDYFEVLRFQALLGATLDAVLVSDRVDSPVYTFLSRLSPPLLSGDLSIALAPQQAVEEQANAGGEQTATPNAPQAEDRTFGVLVEQGEAALADERFQDARHLFETAVRVRQERRASAFSSDDIYLSQRLALATYKSEFPEKLAALYHAIDILAPLHPESTNDSETVRLAAEIEEQLFVLGEGTSHLERAIEYYSRRFTIRPDHRIGVTAAYLLNERASWARDTTEAERIADFVLARRIRENVLALCDAVLPQQNDRDAERVDLVEWDSMTPAAVELERRFWYFAARAEAYVGLGELDAYQAAIREMRQLSPPDWLLQQFQASVNRLLAALRRYSGPSEFRAGYVEAISNLDYLATLINSEQNAAVGD